MKRQLATAFAALALVAAPPAAQAAREEPVHVPKPGYTCTVGEQFATEIAGSRTLDQHGVQLGASLEWRGRVPGGDWSDPQFSGSWSVEGPEPLSLAGGSVWLTWPRQGDTGSRRAIKAWLELTTVPRDTRWPPPPFSSSDKAERSPRIATTWGDLIAFARGAERLTMVVRDKRWRIVEQTPVDPALFTAAEGRLRTALGRLDAMAVEFREKCAFVEDLDADYDVIII